MFKSFIYFVLFCIPLLTYSQKSNQWLCSPDLTIRTDFISDASSLIDQKKSIDLNAEFSFNQSFGLELNCDNSSERQKYFFEKIHSYSICLRYYLYSYDYTGVHFGPAYKKKYQNFTSTDSHSINYNIERKQQFNFIGISSGYQLVFSKHFVVDPTINISEDIVNDFLDVDMRLNLGWILN